MSVGVLIPVRAPAPFLAEALDAVLAQQPAPERVLVVDDGSEPALRLDPRHAPHCKLVRLPRGQGVAAARNAGLEALDTEWVALADADDIWRPGKLAAQLAALSVHPEADLCFGSVTAIGADGEPTGERWVAQPPAGLVAPETLAALVYQDNPIPTSSVIVRRATLLDAGGFRPRPVASDLDMWLRLAGAGRRMVCEPAAGILYRRHNGGLTGDVAALAEGAMAVHGEHAGLVDEATRRHVRARDLRTLAAGRIRQRRYAEARAALAESASLAPPDARARALALLVRVPGLRAALGRRDPYARN